MKIENKAIKNIYQDIFTFDQLVLDIKHIDNVLRESTVKAINRTTTMRNWLIGAYIIEYEQKGADRAKYGTKLIDNLAVRLGKGFSAVALRKSRAFYSQYPQIIDYIKKQPTVSVKLLEQIRPTVSVETVNRTVSTDPSCRYFNSGQDIVTKLSFSHIIELLAVEDPLVRFFYETECIKNTWSVRELRRQITTNLHIRIGLSINKLEAMSKANAFAEQDTAVLRIRDPYTFEFLGLRPQDVYEERDLENALIEHLQEFILELGKGFCFEARQKRIIIDDEYYFADLVFYNRLLHCSVIFEIKNDEFRHEHLGQLNAYVSYFKENEMNLGDNPPIGVLLCTKKGEKMVEYALGGMDQQLFVSTYQLQLPRREEFESFIEQERKDFNQV